MQYGSNHDINKPKVQSKPSNIFRVQKRVCVPQKTRTSLDKRYLTTINQYLSSITHTQPKKWHPQLPYPTSLPSLISQPDLPMSVSRQSKCISLNDVFPKKTWKSLMGLVKVNTPLDLVRDIWLLRMTSESSLFTSERSSYVDGMGVWLAFEVEAEVGELGLFRVDGVQLRAWAAWYCSRRCACYQN